MGKMDNIVKFTGVRNLLNKDSQEMVVKFP